MLAIYGDIEEEARRGISAAQQQKNFRTGKMPLSRTSKLLLTLLLVAAAAWLGNSTTFYNEALVSAFLGIALGNAPSLLRSYSSPCLPRSAQENTISWIS
jgi:hypothetical protein